MSLSPDRKGRLTASVFANAIGIGYDSRQKLWRQLTGREAAFQGNEMTDWGTEHEPDAIDAYEAETGLIVMHSGDHQKFVIQDWMGATPDGIVYDDKKIVIEAKCPYSQQLYDDVPAHYMPQIQGQIQFTDAHRAHFVCWTPDSLAVWEVCRSDEYWEACLPHLEEFYQYWQDDIEPKRRAKPKLPTVNTLRII